MPDARWAPGAGAPPSCLVPEAPPPCRNFMKEGQETLVVRLVGRVCKVQPHAPRTLFGVMGAQRAGRLARVIGHSHGKPMVIAMVIAYSV